MSEGREAARAGESGREKRRERDARREEPGKAREKAWELPRCRGSERFYGCPYIHIGIHTNPFKGAVLRLTVQFKVI